MLNFNNKNNIRKQCANTKYKSLFKHLQAMMISWSALKTKWLGQKLASPSAQLACLPVVSRKRHWLLVLRISQWLPPPPSQRLCSDGAIPSTTSRQSSDKFTNNGLKFKRSLLKRLCKTEGWFPEVLWREMLTEGRFMWGNRQRKDRSIQLLLVLN